ncbi:MAG TPA: GNAT family N-acetyltransferase [Longimicrobiaceae bacterium]|nr:GNAT family N-acetyltransferase [Longimicrobiaceae bacterium]
MEIVHLADRPELVPTLAEWFHAEWGHIVPWGTVEGFGEMFRGQLRRDGLPLALVALEGGAPIGTASVRVADMPERPERTPWLGGVYVLEAARGRGVGEALVRAAERCARELGFREMYLFTTDREGFYLRLGWSVLEYADHHGERASVMRTSL